MHLKLVIVFAFAGVLPPASCKALTSLVGFRSNGKLVLAVLH